MTRTTISLNEDVKKSADRAVTALQKKDARVSFSSYVEDLIRKDLLRAKAKAQKPKGAAA